MNIKENIKKLFETKTNYAIWKATGIAQTTLGDYTKGISDIGNMKLDHALTLNDYYIKNKEMLEMKKTKEIIRSKYRVDGEDQKYIEVIESYNDLDPEETVIDKLERSLKKGQELEKLNFPIIFFDDSNSDSGQIFEADETEDAIRAASEYFEAK